MSTVLLDTNVLLALGIPHHTEHLSATRWFDGRWGQPWATCPIVEAGLVRISANLRKTPGAGSLPQAVQTLKDLCKAPGHVFWPDDYSLNDEAALFGRLQGHNQVTDAYLLLLAHRRKGKLATFDAGIKALARELLGDDKRVLLIPHSVQ